jgi:hypothetical protein
MICPLEVTPGEFEQFKDCEAVMIREFEKESDQSRTARVVAWGDFDEIEHLASRHSIIVVPVGWTCVGQKTVKVSDLK